MISKKTNIIFMFADQQRFDTLGCYGQKLPVTPNLDRLAREGTKFNYAFTCQPVCTPARACMQSGKYATEIGVFTNNMSLPVDIKTLAMCFNEEGYDTAYVGKWHLASDIDNDFVQSAVPVERRGGYKDYWMASDVLEHTSHGYNGYVFDKENKRHDFIGYRADCIQEYALDFIRNRKSDNPFFLCISHIEPHHQNDHKVVEGPDGSKEKWRNYEVPGDLIGTEGNWEENYPDYLGACNALDNNVEKLMDTLKAYGLLENTVFIYASDHGCHFKTRNPEYKRSCHESSIRIPMVAYGPGFMGGSVVNELVSLIDIPATLLDCAGIEKPSDYQGHSMLQLAKGENDNWPEAVFLQISENHIGRAVRTHKYTYSIRACGHASNQKDAEIYYDYQLYDLENDYYQKNNLINKPGYEDITARMREIMKAKMAEAREPEPVILPNSKAPAEWHDFNEKTRSMLKTL